MKEKIQAATLRHLQRRLEIPDGHHSARMKGMKKKLTSKKTANDPDSRINKSLRSGTAEVMYE